MKKIIERKLYDTETAKLLHEWNNGRSSEDFKFYMKNLYRTKKGAFFLHYRGGAMTDMAVQAGNSYSGSENIEPIETQDVISFLESHEGAEVLVGLSLDEIEET